LPRNDGGMIGSPALRTRLARAALALAVALAACGGHVELDSPLSAVGHPYDPRLVGDWYAAGEVPPASQDEDKIFLLRIRPSETPAVLSARYVEVETKNSVKSLFEIPMSAHASELDGRVYYNVRVLPSGADATSEPLGYMLVYPEFNHDGSMSILFLANPTLKRLVEEGWIAAGGGKKSDGAAKRQNLRLSLSSAELADLIRRTPHEDLFGPTWYETLREFRRDHPAQNPPIAFRRLEPSHKGK
jgi:hypothetical protein